MFGEDGYVVRKTGLTEYTVEADGEFVFTAKETWFRPRKEFRVTDLYGSSVLRVKAKRYFGWSYTVVDERSGETVGTIKRFHTNWLDVPKWWLVRDATDAEVAWFRERGESGTSPPGYPAEEQSTFRALPLIVLGFVLLVLLIILEEWASTGEPLDRNPEEYTVIAPDGTRRGSFTKRGILALSPDDTKEGTVKKSTLDLSEDSEQEIDRRLALAATMAITD